jgi:protein-S-isoprenylcysteine O-methyltransferase Ste14
VLRNLERKYGSWDDFSGLGSADFGGLGAGEIVLIGVAIMLWRLDFFLFLVVVIPIQIFRAGREGRVLGEKFGEEYREYRRRTWF